jgi:hypothetical protein
MLEKRTDDRVVNTRRHQLTMEMKNEREEMMSKEVQLTEGRGLL